jgi:ketosteroid isomerase-like protein
VFDHDVAALSRLFTEDLVFHVRGPLPSAGDHRGVEGFLGALGTLFELTGGDIKLEQLACFAEDSWGVEWEQAHFTRNGRTLEARDAFVYRFEGGRIAEIWLLSAAPAESAAFWS